MLLTAETEPQNENQPQSENEAQIQSEPKRRNRTPERNLNLRHRQRGSASTATSNSAPSLWDYSGEPLPQCVMSDLAAFLARPAYDELLEVLSSGEVDAALERAELLLESGVFPTDPSGQRWPWPIV